MRLIYYHSLSFGVRLTVIRCHLLLFIAVVTRRFSCVTFSKRSVVV